MRDCEAATPDWLSAAAKFGFAINAARLGFSASAEKAFALADKVANAADCRLTASNAFGLAIIAADACGLASTAFIADESSFPEADAEAASACALYA